MKKSGKTVGSLIIAALPVGVLITVGLYMALISYAIIVIAFIRPVAGHLAYSFLKHSNNNRYGVKSDSPSIDQWVGGYFWGVLLAALWPVVGIISLTNRFTIGSEKEFKNEQQKAYVKKLERELGIN